MKSLFVLRAGLLAVLLAATSAGACATLIGNGLDGNFYSVDTATGATTSLGAAGTHGLMGISYQPATGVLFGLTNFQGTLHNALVTIDPLTWAATKVGQTNLSALVEGDLAFNPLNGNLYGVWDLTTGGLFFQIDPFTGAATPIGTLPLGGDYSALAFDAAGTLYAIDTAGGDDSVSHLLKIDPLNGVVLSSTALNVNLGAVAGLAFDPLTGMGYVADGDNAGTDRLYRLDTGTSVLTSVGLLGPDLGLAGLAFGAPPNATPIPEPGTTLFGLALVAACVAARRRVKTTD